MLLSIICPVNYLQLKWLKLNKKTPLFKGVFLVYIESYNKTGKKLEYSSFFITDSNKYKYERKTFW